MQPEREPEIIRIQQLQAQEMGQAELLHKSAFVRWGARTFGPIIRPGIKYSWLRRQKQMRQGVTKVKFAFSQPSSSKNNCHEVQPKIIDIS